ncbi:hypothetical protein [Pseudanabaena sp. BC1403]|uniref:hypothetical protein n=1 Tax=Pseudanabaena sp. BC1403 TaxID=2043171 RepID=UPI000CD98443|nr:hypothetical protein [Pseudanabaena sp. BC1403]
MQFDTPLDFAIKTSSQSKSLPTRTISQSHSQCSLLYRAYTTVKYLLDDLGLSKEEQRSHLKSVLEDLQAFWN